MMPNSNHDRDLKFSSPAQVSAPRKPKFDTLGHASERPNPLPSLEQAREELIATAVLGFAVPAAPRKGCGAASRAEFIREVASALETVENATARFRAICAWHAYDAAGLLLESTAGKAIDALEMLAQNVLDEMLPALNAAADRLSGDSDFNDELESD